MTSGFSSLWIRPFVNPQQILPVGMVFSTSENLYFNFPISLFSFFPPQKIIPSYDVVCLIVFLLGDYFRLRGINMSGTFNFIENSVHYVFCKLMNLSTLSRTFLKKQF